MADRDIVIRKIRLQDAEALSRLDREIFSEPWSEKIYAEILEHSYNYYLVAVRGEELLGCVGMADICHEGNIDRVMVAPAERRQGLAKKMLERLFETGEEIGIEAYTLEVRAGNATAIRLYEKLGFIEEGVRQGFYEHPKEDAVIMWRRQKL